MEFEQDQFYLFTAGPTSSRVGQQHIVVQRAKAYTYWSSVDPKAPAGVVSDYDDKMMAKWTSCEGRTCTKITAQKASMLIHLWGSSVK